MHRIDNVTAAALLPTPASAGTAGYFSNATPGSGTPTIVDNDWCNDIQEELISILTAASVAPSKTTHNQVLTALEDLFPLKAGVLLAANNLSDLGTLATALTNLGFASDSASYFKIPNPNNTAKPLIVQFGPYISNSGGATSVTFPVTFPNAVISIAGCSKVASSQTHVINSSTTSGFTGTSYSTSSGSPVGALSAWYIAIGN